MRKGKKQRGDIMEQIKRRFAHSSMSPIGVTIERSITTCKKEGTVQNRQRSGDQAVGVEIISSYAMKMDMGKLGDRLNQNKSNETDDGCTTDDSTDGETYHHRSVTARYQSITKQTLQDPGEECRGCTCCCCPCKKRLLQNDEYKILLCGVTTGIQALIERARKNEEESEKDVNRTELMESRKARCKEAMMEGPVFMRRKAASIHRMIEDVLDKENDDCYMIAKPAGRIWKLEWKSKDELLQGMKKMGLVQFSKFVRNWCFYHEEHVTGPRKLTPKEYDELAEHSSDCENIPFNNYRFDKLHQVASMLNIKWVNLMRAQEDDDYDTIRKRNDMLVCHYRILDKFDFDKGLGEYDAQMRAYRLTHPCSNSAKVPDIDCRICGKPLKGSLEVVILLDALQYIHFDCICEIMKMPVFPRAPPGLLRPKASAF